MPTNIKDYSTTQSSNTSLNGISTAEGMLPSNLNNAIRALMKNTRDWFNDAQWIEYGDGSGSYTAAYASSTSFTIAGSAVGVTHSKFKKWHQPFLDNLSTSIKLHKIEKLIVVNHEDCGAIKLAENKKDYIEKEIHQSSFQKLEKKLIKSSLN